jgi:ribonuclease R
MPKHSKKGPAKKKTWSKRPHKKPNQKRSSSLRLKNTKPIYGVIAISGKGVGYVSNEQFDSSIEIPFEALSGAFPRDLVEVQVLRGGEKPLGKVTKIVTRSRDQFVGTIVNYDGAFLLQPDNFKIPYPIVIKDKKAEDIGPTKKVLVSVTQWTDGKKRTEAKIESVIGNQGEHETEIQSIILGKGFSLHFPEEVLEAAAEVKNYWSDEVNWKKEVATRLDLRDILTFTIDPWNAKDFDDAISLKILGDDEYEVGIHIADVSHFVERGSVLDKEAEHRATSVYLVDRTIPMLPEVLSNDLCSLNPNEEKFAFSAILTIDKKGIVSKRRFGKSIIKSDKRFTYEDAQKSINDAQGEYHKELSLLNDIAKTMRGDRSKKGAIDFETTEFDFKLDADKKPIKIFKKKRLDAHKLVEEYMLLANREVAEFMYKHNESKNKGRGGNSAAHFIYRIHDFPDPEKVANLTLFLKAFGYEFEFNQHEKISSKDIQKLLKKIEGSPIEQLVKTAAIRTMSKAIYSTKNIGHFGLSFEYYTHFTSPIRRYPDLIVHRLLFRELTSQKIESNEFERWQHIADESTAQEILASEAERESIKFKQAEYMAGHIGETFKGTISGVTEFGLYVEDSETGAEGMVKLRDLGDDYFVVNPKTYSVLGKQTKKQYSLGDSVTYKVMRVDPLKRQLDYQIIG